MWIFYVALVASSGILYAFPQNDNVSPAIVSTFFGANGFVFDGPADGPTTNERSTTVRSTSLPTTSPSTESTTTMNVRTCISRCPTTVEYHPVCGSDKKDYENPGQLGCAAMCGIDVTISFFGKCNSSNLRG